MVVKMCDISPCIQQHLHDFGIIIFIIDGIKKRCPAVFICLIDVNSLIDQIFHDIRLKFGYGIGRSFVITRSAQYIHILFRNDMNISACIHKCFKNIIIVA